MRTALAMSGTRYPFVADRFALLERIGSGGEAVVYRARDLTTDRDVALKLFHDNSPVTTRHLNEAAVLRGLENPFIVGYVAHGVWDARSYIATQWVSGETLAARLTRGPLDPETALLCIRGVAAALACIHERGLVHRDVKPSNILLRDGDPAQPTLLDFGISLAPVVSGLRDMSARGTPNYVAPEQATGQVDVAAAADLFALGCVLHACLTGAPPFDADNAIAVLSKIVLAPAPPLVSVPGEYPGLDALRQRLLAKSAAGRPRDGRIALDLIDAVLRREPLFPQTPSAYGSAVESSLLSVVAMRTGALGGVSGHTDTAPTVAIDQAILTARVVSELARVGGRAVEMPGLVLVIVTGSGGVRRNAKRAARCALRLQKEWRGARIGIATASGVVALKWPVGPVIEDVLALLAATEDAAPGIYIDAATATFVAAAFEIDEDGGGHRSLRAERVPVDRGAPTLVGRDAELDAIVHHAMQAPDGASFALITGPPGIGKSRFAEEVVSRLRLTAPTIRVWSCSCDPMRIGASFGVIGALLRSALKLPSDAGFARASERATARLADLGEPSATSLGPLLACLATAPSPHAAPKGAAIDPAAFRRDLRRAWIRWIEAEARRTPIALLIDDLQWTDPETLGFLNVLDQISAGRVLVLGFARPDLRDRYPIRVPPAAQGTELVLHPLDADACRALAAEILGNDENPAHADRIEQVCAQAGGNPLALIELAREAGRDPSSSELELVPLMLARLELLAPEQRRVLRIASVFGQHFPLSWIQHATARDATAMETRAIVDALRALGILDVHRGEEYRFHHRAIRDAAYSLLRGEDRVALHAAAAAWQKTAFTDRRVALGTARIVPEHLRLHDVTTAAVRSASCMQNPQRSHVIDGVALSRIA